MIRTIITFLGLMESLQTAYRGEQGILIPADPDLQQKLIHGLVRVSTADGPPSALARKSLESVAAKIGLDAAELDRLIQESQVSFNRQSTATQVA